MIDSVALGSAAGTGPRSVRAVATISTSPCPRDLSDAVEHRTRAGPWRPARPGPIRGAAGMTSTWPATRRRATPFVGRGAELARLRAVVCGGGGSAVVRGPAGVGKTALLDEVVRAAPGRVLRATGVESEAVLPFATAAELLLPLQEFFPRLPEAQRDALEVALGLRDGPVPGPLATCTATFEVLTAAAEHSPLLVVVDDLQWVDPSSRQALLFTARRLAGGPVVLLMGIRDDPAGPDLPAALPTVELGGMTQPECAALAAALGVTAAPLLVREVYELTGGNPLVVVELLRSDRDPASAPTVGGLWEVAVDRLPTRTRAALVVVAAGRSAAVADLVPALDALGLTLDDLVPAEETELVRESGGEIRFRHPLLRSSILERGSVAVPEMTPHGRTRARRLFEAATDATLAGAAELALPWCAEALAAVGDEPVFAADIELLRARVLMSIGRPVPARDGLAAAARRVRDADPVRAADLFAEAAMAGAIGGDLRRSAELARECEAVLPLQRRSLAAVVMPAMALLAAGDTGGTARLEHADRMIAVDGGDPLLVATLAQGLIWAQRYELAQPRLDAVVETARRTGAPLALAYALAVRSELETWTAHWPAAYADAEESLRWATELGQVTWIGKALHNLAWLDAARGDGGRCRERMERAEHEVLTRGVECMRVYLAAVLGFCALGEDRPGYAVEHLERALAAAATAGLDGPTVVPFAGDLVEALIRAGDTVRAEVILDRLDERAAGGPAHPAVVVARCRGLLADDVVTAERQFARAHRIEVGRPMPFERARTLLARATTLRRLGHAVAARTPLRDAHAAFELLGARPWAAQAAAELAAAGATRRSVFDATGLATLTGPELQIARAVAHGRSNVELAAALFVSRKTIEAHLTRIYRKLGLRSRTELARAVVGAERSADSTPVNAAGEAVIDGAPPAETLGRREPIEPAKYLARHSAPTAVAETGGRIGHVVVPVPATAAMYHLTPAGPPDP